ncbi:hemolysin family protein [Novispirillum sp. DQ9]|uniref:hemolysin family protein n=1 Tax=Novispirillum sp. DQ9 TaxID=3398612 RepID=UPI003C7EB8E5
MSVWFELSILGALLLLNGFLAMSELAVVSSRKARLQAMADAGSKGARRALRLLDNSGSFLSTVQIGITLVGVVAGAFSGATLALRLSAWITATFPGVGQWSEEVAFTLTVGAITYLSLIVGELVPKQIALAHPERMAALAARPMALIATIAAPLVWLLDASSAAVLKLLRIQARDSAMSEEELKAVIGESTAAGILAPEENEMLRAVMRFADRRIHTIMTPRMEIDWLDIDEPHEEIVARIRATKHSRYPLCRGNVNELLGVVQAKDILDCVLAGKDFNLGKMMRDVEVVPETAGALGVLERIKRAPIHMAVVVDEYGAVEGLVTASDIMAELVGGMSEHGESWEPQAVMRDDGSWLIDGDMDAERAADLVGHPGVAGQGRYATLAGFLLSGFRTLPTSGESFEHDGYRFEVVDMDGRRIDKVLVVPPATTVKETDADAS